ncbi:MAG: HlyD family efflux transporter periplasmic adaptor subunit [Pseudomonadota bacterium]
MPNQTFHSESFSTLNRIQLPRLARTVTWCICIAIVAVGLFLAFVPWVQTTTGRGQVTALDPDDRMQDINALVSGRIEEWFVRDGSEVSVGDPIVRLVDNDPLLLERLNLERLQVESKLEAASSAVQTAEIDLRRTKNLLDQGLAAERDYERAQIRVEELRSRVAEAAAELNRVDISLSRQSVQMVRAPRDGVIVGINGGDSATYVSTGDILATFVPMDATRAIELYIDGRDIALVQPGAPVRLQFEGWPVIQLSGWPSLAVGTFEGTVAVVDPSANSTGKFRLLIVEDPEAEVPWPDDRFIRFGAKARGWVLLETVRAGYEVWRQLNNFPPDFPTTGQ